MMVIFSIIMYIGFYINDQIAERRRNATAIYQKEKSAIETENAIKIASALAQAKLQEVPTTNELQMREYLTDQIKNHIKPPLEIKKFEVKFPEDIYYAKLTSGPFKGMDAESRKLIFSLSIGPISNNSANLKNSTLTMETIISNVPITQFTYFSAANTLYFGAGYQPIEFSGRIHSNGDISLAGTTNQLKVRGSLTAAWSIRAPNSVFGGPPIWQTHVALAPTYADSTLLQIKDGADSGCSNCDGTTLSWAQYAMNRWLGQVQDQHHGVAFLSIKTLEIIDAQKEGARFPIEPVRPGENLGRKEKFAYKADIRIINGVWYLKNPNNADEWPGVPIWSDHPGSFTTWNDDNIEGVAKAVGQDDIRSRLATNGPVGNAWPSGTTPQKFSFYGYNSTTKSLIPNSSATVSYGNLFRDSSTVTWSPGHYPTASLCDTGETCSSGCGIDVVSTASTITCRNTTTGVETIRSRPLANLLNATRGGFRVGVLQNHAAGANAKSKIWPMNFDLSAFQNALKCQAGTDHPGELGCYFGTGRFMGRAFNGVIYIGNTWDNQNTIATYNSKPGQRSPYMQNDTETVHAIEGGGPTAYPGTTNDVLQPTPHAAAHAQLPMQLCSTSLAGEKFTAEKFIIPNCESYKNHRIFRARTNALRVINARQILATELPKGVSIVTNLPVFTVGDVNANSDVSSPSSTPWLPVFIAGDNYVPLSNSWNDSFARWDVRTDHADVTGKRNAANTTINAATSPRILFYNENWGGRSLNKTGPHIDFCSEPHSWYQSSQIIYGAATYNNPAVIYYKEDPHFRAMANQPPGVPMVSIFTINTWITKESANE